MPRWSLDTSEQGLKEALRELYEHMRREKRQREKPIFDSAPQQSFAKSA